MLLLPPELSDAVSAAAAALPRTAPVASAPLAAKLQAICLPISVKVTPCARKHAKIDVACTQIPHLMVCMQIGEASVAMPLTQHGDRLVQLSISSLSLSMVPDAATEVWHPRKYSTGVQCPQIGAY